MNTEPRGGFHGLRQADRPELSDGQESHASGISAGGGELSLKELPPQCSSQTPRATLR